MQREKLSQFFCAAVIVSTNRLVLPELLGYPLLGLCPALLANVFLLAAFNELSYRLLIVVCLWKELHSTPFFLPLCVLKSLQRLEQRPG